jgi:hypothetical protein
MCNINFIAFEVRSVDTQLPRLANRLRLLVWIGIVMLIILPSLVWLDPDVKSRWPGDNLEWTPLDRIIAASLSLPPMLMAAFGLGRLLAFCRSVREGRVFTEEAADSLRGFGKAVIAAALLLPLSRLAVWAYIGSLPIKAAFWGRLVFGQVALTSGVGLAVGLALIVFGAILREATRIADENASFL